jgi:hypothetical protein
MDIYREYLMPLNPPTWKGPDVYYSTNVFVNKVPVALWQPPAGAFNDGKPGTRIIAGARMYADNQSGTQRFIKDQIALFGGEDAAKDDTDGTPGTADVPQAPNANKSTTTGTTSTSGTTGSASMLSQPGEVELKISDIPESFSRNINDPIYKKRISKYFTLAHAGRPFMPQLGLSQKGLATNWINLCVNVLDPARDAGFGFTTLNSGFRDIQSNSRIAGASNKSEHMYAKAADIQRGVDQKKLFLWILKSGIPFSQLLIEKANNYWVHVSYDGGRKNEQRGAFRVGYLQLSGGRVVRKEALGPNGERAESFIKSL